MTTEIKVEAPKRGTLVALALIGNARRCFEIWSDGALAEYWVDDTQVTREVYFDCMKTIEKDRFGDLESDFEDLEPQTKPETNGNAPS